VRLLFPARVHLDAAFTEFDIHARDLIATRCAVAGKYEETIKKPIDFLKDIERISI